MTAQSWLNSSSSNGNTSSNSADLSRIISDELLYWTQIVCFIGLCGTMSIFGIFANVINITVFIRQGVLSDSSTVSLFVLAVCDILSLVTMLWLGICYIIIYAEVSGLTFDPMSVLFLTAGRPHVMFTDMSCFTIVYISFERCICVMFPFKVKNMFTASRTAVILPVMCVSLFISFFLPLYVVEHLKWQMVPGTNKTLLSTYKTKDFQNVNHVVSWINGTVIRPLALFGVIIFTQATIIRVNASSKWRKATAAVSANQNSKTNPPNSDVTKSTSSDTTKGKGDVGEKDMRLVKMIRTICTIYIVCFIPDTCFVVAERIKPEISPGGKYHNLFFFLYNCSFLLEAFNSSVNILVYYKMSTRYRREFWRLFNMHKDTK